MKKNPAVPDDLRAHLRAEYTRAWGKDVKMVDFCCKKISRAIWLDDKTAFIWEKPSIKTDFCFGESGHDYDEAQEMAAHAKNSTEYFKRENLREFDEIIKELEQQSSTAEHGAFHYCLRQLIYSSAGPMAIYTLGYECSSDYLFTRDTGINPLREPSEKELTAIIEGYKAERTAFEKRLDTYLKRYGLSKVNSWTYWREA